MIKRILIVGAGLSGSTLARELAEAGFFVTVIDKRDHIGGNVYDYVCSEGIRIHKYGPHIFHTNNVHVYKWLEKFTEWVEYRHKVKGILDDGRLVTIPPNLETKEILGANRIIDVLFKPYTRKMWGVDLEHLDPQIVKRISIRDDNNELYFPNDKFQALPMKGYSQMIANILDHKNICVKLKFKFHRIIENNFDFCFNSMPIDEYYDFKFGPLPYRSIKFHKYTIPIPFLLPLPTINLTNYSKYTRVTEWKRYPMHGENPDFTVLTFEEPCDYRINQMERYYPVKDINGLNRDKYLSYKSIKNPNVVFIGRCGLYSYIDMDQAVSESLKTAERFLKVWKQKSLL